MGTLFQEHHQVQHPRHLFPYPPGAVQPKVAAISRVAAPAPPVKWPDTVGTAQPQMPVQAHTSRSALPLAPIPPVRMPGAARDSQPHLHTAAQPHSPAIIPPQRPVAPIPPVRWADQASNSPPTMPEVAQPQRPTAPITLVRMPGAPGLVQRQTSGMGGARPVTDNGQPQHHKAGRVTHPANHKGTGEAPGEKVRSNCLSTQASDVLSRAGASAHSWRHEAPRSAGTPRGAIQPMIREKTPQSHNYIVPHQPIWYQAHVTQRIKHCVTVTLKLWTYHQWARGRAYHAQLRRMGSGISPTAEAQVGVGNYGATGGKLDAAHLMNTTVRDQVLAEGQHLTPKQASALAELHIASAATTMQLKSNNVGPDKVIDTCMTTFTRNCAGLADAGNGVPSVNWAITTLSTLCLNALQNSPNAGNPNYQEAIAGVQAATVDDWAIAYEMTQWAQENGFV